MSTAPAATPVTVPLATVATDVSEDRQFAAVVTFCEVLLASVAVAVNCEVFPTTGAVPLTVRPLTLGDVGELLQAANGTTRPTRMPKDFSKGIVRNYRNGRAKPQGASEEA
jgi:hypothetical protein